MLKSLLAVFVVTLSIISYAQDKPYYDQPPDPEKAAAAQTQIAAAIAAAGCGPSEIQFDVKADNQQHPMPQAETGKALIYIFEDGNVGSMPMRIGIDSKWVGATLDGAYMFFATDPGEHRLCVNAQSDKAASPGTAGTLAVEPGRIYYFQVQAYGSLNSFNLMQLNSIQLQQLDNANGQYMVATHSLSLTKTPPKPQKHNDDPTNNP